MAAGLLDEVVRRAKQAFDHEAEPVIVLDDSTSHPLEIDFRTDVEAILRILENRRLLSGPAAEPPEKRGPGRPKLGVLPREVTLLPRHWTWLAGQPGGASVALRKLVEAAMRDPSGADRIRRARESCYRFMSHLVGDEVGFEEAARALFRGDREGFESLTRSWPSDFAAHARRLAAESFAA